MVYSSGMANWLGAEILFQNPAAVLSCSFYLQELEANFLKTRSRDSGVSPREKRSLLQLKSTSSSKSHKAPQIGTNRSSLTLQACPEQVVNAHLSTVCFGLSGPSSNFSVSAAMTKNTAT